MANIRVSTRITAIAVGAVVALAGLSAVFFVGYSNVQDARDTEMAFRQIGRLNNDLRAAALQMRRREKDFLARKKTKYLLGYNVRTGRAAAALTNIARQPHAAPVRKNAEAAGAKIKAHGVVFQGVAGSITQVSQGSSETGHAASQVLTASQDLSTRSERLRSEVDRFLESVRAA